MLFKTIAQMVADKIECNVDEIKMDSAFRDLGIDSLDTVEMVMNLEDKIGREIELEDKVETVGDLVRYIEKKYGI